MFKILKSFNFRRLGFCILVLISSYSFIRVFSSSTEGIVGGITAQRRQFYYQAAILGMRNQSNVTFLLGGGAIVSPSFILTAAHCFLNDSGSVAELSFSVRIGSINLNRKGGWQLDIYRIHFARYDYLRGTNDIALVELQVGIVFGNTHVNKLRLPEIHESFIDRYAFISGYGYNWIERDHSSPVGITGGTDRRLKCAEILILLDIACKDIFNDAIDSRGQFCGVSRIPLRRERAGACMLDGGGPLVFNGRIVGILSRHSPECDDSINGGSIYTKVSYYLEFIYRITEGNLYPNSIIYENPIHIA